MLKKNSSSQWNFSDTQIILFINRNPPFDWENLDNIPDTIKIEKKKGLRRKI